MSDRAITIRVQDVSKCYQIYNKPQHRLWQSLARGRRRFFREFWALRDITFEVCQGETLGIIGRNGSGKSTLLEIITGTLTPSAGHVEIHGKVAAILELGAGFNPEFTGRENVYLNATVLGLSRAEIDARYDAIVAFSEIGEFIDQPIKTYSSGMVVRLAFAVIVHVDADILVIDEALAVGDARFTQKCMRFLRQFRERGTIVFVSHDSGAVVNLCHRALWLEQGALKMAGGPKGVTEAYLAAVCETQGAPADRLNTQSWAKAQLQVDAQVGTDPSLKIDTRLQADADQFPINAEAAYLEGTPVSPIDFNPDSSTFGVGGAVIQGVRLLNEHGKPLVAITGGEAVTLTIRAQARQDLQGPIIGFYVKDRLGQLLFGDNTFIRYQDQALRVQAGRWIEARFCFAMPILPVGDYSICVAIAEGTQMDHVHHHWIHDALLFKSYTHQMCTGLVGIPMQSISMAVA